MSLVVNILKLTNIRHIWKVEIRNVHVGQFWHVRNIQTKALQVVTYVRNSDTVQVVGWDVDAVETEVGELGTVLRKVLEN